MSLTTFHVLAMLFSFCVIFVADKSALAWVRGKKETLSAKRLHVYHWLMWAGLLALIGSGTILLWPQASYLLTQPLFIIKLLFVGVLVANAIIIGRSMEVAITRPFASLSWGELVPLGVSGFVSLFSWVSIVLIAFYLF